jgi:hypothetical protein
VARVRDHLIVLLGPDGLARTWNKSADRLAGYRSEEAERLAGPLTRPCPGTRRPRVTGSCSGRPAPSCKGPTDVIVCNVVMPRLGDVGLSEQHERQGLVGRVPFISDYLDQATGIEGAAVDTEKLLPESFRAEERLNRVRALPDG